MSLFYCNSCSIIIKGGITFLRHLQSCFIWRVEGRIVCIFASVAHILRTPGTSFRTFPKLVLGWPFCLFYCNPCISPFYEFFIFYWQEGRVRKWINSRTLLDSFTCNPDFYMMNSRVYPKYYMNVVEDFVSDRKVAKVLSFVKKIR